jgi:hypothetical protein
MITFPAAYPLNPANNIVGPTEVWYAPYVGAGAEPSTGTIVALGMTSKDGFGYDKKDTYLEVEVDQLVEHVDAFLTKREHDIKFSVVELSASNLNVATGERPDTLIAGSPTIQKLGEFFDLVNGAAPSQRPTYRQWIFRFPAPGYDNTTSPIGKWAYVRFFKAYVFQSGERKFSKDGQTVIPVTLHALADTTVNTSGSKAGEIVLP